MSRGANRQPRAMTAIRIRIRILSICTRLTRGSVIPKLSQSRSRSGGRNYFTETKGWWDRRTGPTSSAASMPSSCVMSAPRYGWMPLFRAWSCLMTITSTCPTTTIGFRASTPRPRRWRRNRRRSFICFRATSASNLRARSARHRRHEARRRATSTPPVCGSSRCPGLWAAGITGRS